MLARRQGLRQIDGDTELAARAAWLYYAGGLTQSEIAKRLNLPATKAHRLITRAAKEGLIRVFVDAEVVACVELEKLLIERFGLDHCTVVPDLEEGPLPLQTLGLAGARYLRGALEQDGHPVIGLGHGRTLASMIDHLPSMKVEGTRFVSLLGGLTRKFAANPFDVIHRLAEKTGAEAYLMPVPLFANSAEDKAVLMKQMGVAEVFAMAREATLLLVGIGEVEASGHLAETSMVREAELAELKGAGAVGEFLGHFFDAAGQPVRTAIDHRAMSPDLAELAGRHLVAIAGGAAKAAAIRAVLQSGYIKGLITDEVSARDLAGPQPVEQKPAPFWNRSASGNT